MMGNTAFVWLTPSLNWSIRPNAVPVARRYSLNSRRIRPQAGNYDAESTAEAGPFPLPIARTLLYPLRLDKSRSDNFSTLKRCRKACRRLRRVICRTHLIVTLRTESVDNHGKQSQENKDQDSQGNQEADPSECNWQGHAPQQRNQSLGSSSLS
ncbi:hypothetical protein Pla22_40950 [Rubripirellula amarantea]|uniref:Uncharacterized protein n=1 Tax=Rubripirellula amarantea TaxID=2527999 RepID=A0A5C5WKJ9_9BACT|nr:hypothetical protein Pla22_40950 [Rubripirellula amarantea]